MLIVSNKSSHETGAADAVSAVIKLKNVITKKSKTISKKEISAALKNHGFQISDRNYIIKAIYQNKSENFKEERTVALDNSEETINIIPNIIIPSYCVDMNNYPIFNRLQEFVDDEIIQVRKEAKI